MPHQRVRYLNGILESSLRASPIIGLMGQRQTGKTTLAELFGGEYVTLDDEESLELALRSAKTFIRGRSRPFVIDECQQSPSLFPALKEHVRTSRAMGQFLLTGSVRFTGVEEIKESLTGRMIELELLPFCLTEVHGLPLTDPVRFLQVKKLAEVMSSRQKSHKVSDPALREFLAKGGLPGICFLRSEILRTRKMRTHIKTILDRDLRMVTRTTLDYLTLKTFLEEIAIQQGEVFDLSRAARGARIAMNSARKLLAGLESVYLVRTILKQGDTHGRLVYLEDQGMASFLLRERGQSFVEFRPVDLNRLLFQQLNAQVKYNDRHQVQLTSYRRRSGTMMDFVISAAGVGRLGYSVGAGRQATPHQIRSAQAFLKSAPGARALLLHLGDGVRELHPGLVEAPIWAAF